MMKKVIAAVLALGLVLPAGYAYAEAPEPKKSDDVLARLQGVYNKDIEEEDSADDYDSDEYEEDAEDSWDYEDDYESDDPLAGVEVFGSELIDGDPNLWSGVWNSSARRRDGGDWEQVSYEEFILFPTGVALIDDFVMDYAVLSDQTAAVEISDAVKEEMEGRSDITMDFEIRPITEEDAEAYFLNQFDDYEFLHYFTEPGEDSIMHVTLSYTEPESGDPFSDDVINHSEEFMMIRDYTQGEFFGKLLCGHVWDVKGKTLAISEDGELDLNDGEMTGTLDAINETITIDFEEDGYLTSSVDYYPGEITEDGITLVYQDDESKVLPFVLVE